MTNYTNVRVSISEGQKVKIKRAMEAGVGVSIRLSHEDLSGNDVSSLTRGQMNKMGESHLVLKGVKIKMSKTQLAYNAKVDGGFIGALLPLLATAGRVLVSKALPSSAMGALSGVDSAAGSKVMDKISGAGAIYIKRGGMTCKAVPMGSGGLYLKPYTGSGLDNVGEGLYLKSGNGGFVTGCSDPIRHSKISRLWV